MIVILRHRSLGGTNILRRIIAEANWEREVAARARDRQPHRTPTQMWAHALSVDGMKRLASRLMWWPTPGAYRPAHRLSDPQRHVRARLLVRDALVGARTRYISLIRALIRQHGYRIPSGSAEGKVPPS